MSILWCGGEDIDFPTKGMGFTVGTTAAWFRAGYARAAVYANGATVSRGPAIATPITTVWASARIYTFSLSGLNAVFLGIGRSGKTGRISLGNDSATPGKLALWKTDESSVKTKLATEAGTSLSVSNLFRFDMKITTFGASGNVKIYLNGDTTALIDFTGDLTWTTGPTDLDQLVLDHGVAASLPMYSECLLADEDTRAMSLVTLAPNAAGDANTLDGGLYTDIDETTNSDADILTSNTTGQVAQFNLAALPAGSFAIRAVKEVFRGIKGATGLTQWKHGVKTGGTINTVTSAMAESWASYERLMLTNPVTAVDWTPAEINALQWACESLT